MEIYSTDMYLIGISSDGKWYIRFMCIENNHETNHRFGDFDTEEDVFLWRKEHLRLSLLGKEE